MSEVSKDRRPEDRRPEDRGLEDRGPEDRGGGDGATPADRAAHADPAAAPSTRPVHPDAVVPPTDQGTAASGGYGVGSGRRSSGGSGDAGEDSVPAGSDPETEWLRSGTTTGDGR